jgi:hypothetical protein
MKEVIFWFGVFALLFYVGLIVYGLIHAIGRMVPPEEQGWYADEVQRAKEVCE